MDTAAFLRHVLPEEGWKCIGIKQEHGYRHRFAETFEEAASYALEMDAAGETIYFACATFREPNNRKQDNAAYLKSLFADVDVGPDKPYRTRQEASAALTDFLLTTKLPIPTTVNSGLLGMHIYIVLDEELTPEQWKPYAVAFRELCRQHGFHIDPVRTADCSSVLRPIGTHNRKHGLVYPVTIAYVSEPVWVGDLDLGLRLHEEQPQRQRPFKRRLLEGASAYADAPSDANKVAANCLQIGHVRDVKGDVPYYPWLFTLWTLHHCTDGDKWAHEWSVDHPNYSYEETQRKLDEGKGPITCKKFHEHHPEPCEKCQYWGKLGTPLQLGRDYLPAGLADQHAHRKEQFDAGTTQSQPLEGNCWSNDEHGLRFQTEDNDGNKDYKLITRWPLVLQSYCRSERNVDRSLVFRMDTAQEGEQIISIPSGTFFSALGMPEMHRLGVVVHEPDMLRKYVREQIDSYTEQSEPQTRFDQFGWKNDDTAFLCGNRLYVEKEIITAVGSPEIERRARMLGPRGGSLSAWSAAANQLFATGCEPHSFALCCAFGAVLMHFHTEEGGAIVNLVSAESATGKTVALEAVASVWGELDGIRLTDEDTKVSRGLLLGTLGNLPCVFDELHRRDPDAIRQFCIMFTNGRDKLRGKSDGTLREPIGDWQTILVLGSNLSLVDILQARTEEAQAYRILEFPVEATFTGHEGDRLLRQLKVNAGWAGDAFLQALLYPGMLDEVRSEMQRIMDILWDKWKQPGDKDCYGFDKRHRFWVRCLAAAYTAGRLVNHLGILQFDPTRVINWAIDRCKNRNVAEVKRDYVQVLNEALYDVWAMTLVVDVEWSGPKRACNILSPPSSKGFYARRVRESGRMYVSRTWLREWMTEHMVNRQAFTEDLQKQLIIVKANKFVTLGAGTHLSVGGQIMCYEIDMHHHRMSEMLMAVERDVPPDVRQEKPLATVLRFSQPDRAASAAPPEPSR